LLFFFTQLNRDVLENTLRGNFEFKQNDWENISDSAQSLVRAMMSLEPSDRPSFQQVLAHPWLNKSSFGSLNLLEQLKFASGWSDIAGAQKKVDRVSAAVGVSAAKSLRVEDITVTDSALAAPTPSSCGCVMN
jgi:serine/threonine protein kinase